MDLIKITTGALEKAYENQVSKLYAVYVDALVTSENNEEKILSASERFKRGLKITQTALSKTLSLIGEG